jgi:hypothetical protein
MPTAQTFGGSQIPDLGANLAATIFFGMATVFHFVVGTWFKQWWFMSTWTIGLSLELAGYVSRVVGHYNPTNKGAYMCQTAVLTVAPALLMAGIYYQLGTFIRIYGRKYALLGPKMTQYLFIAADVFAILVQALGGGMAAAAYNNGNSDRMNNGRKIMIVGLVVQVIGTTFFLVVLLWFYSKVFMRGLHKQLEDKHDLPDLPAAESPAVEMTLTANGSTSSLRINWPFPTAILFSTLLIYGRSIFRIIELSQGWDGDLMYHEIYFLILDTLFVALATVSLSIFHPGFIYGRRRRN